MTIHQYGTMEQCANKPEVKHIMTAPSGAQEQSSCLVPMACFLSVSVVNTFDVFSKPEEGEPEKTCHLTEGKALLWSS